MQRIVLIIVFFAVLIITATAFAQDEPKTKFYDFDDMMIDGELKVPEGLRQGAHKKAKFKRLLNLKKSFLSKIRETSGEKTLQ